IDECFVFEDDGGVAGINDELLADFTELAEHYGVPVLDNRLSNVWREYLTAEFEYPGAVVLYRLGDFYEVMGNRASEAAQVLDLTLTGRDVGLGKREPMCGFPVFALDEYSNKLKNAGFDLAIIEDGKTERISADVENIDYLERAKRLINEYCQQEFSQDADLGNIKEIGLAYTTVTDRELETQVNANLEDFTIDRYVSGVLADQIRFKDLREMCAYLEDLDFNDLTDYTDEQIKQAEKAASDRRTDEMLRQAELIAKEDGDGETVSEKTDPLKAEEWLKVERAKAGFDIQEPALAPPPQKKNAIFRRILFIQK
ncbi:MAG: hypothetical protein IJT91_01140, partial [Clostridia bacterium]|nr:hypothetical protein [Clostridia bacterium]